MSVDNDERSWRPSTSTAPENIAKVRAAILADHRQTVHGVCDIVGLSQGPFNSFWPTTWTRDAFLRALCQDCWATTRRPIAFLSTGNSNKKPETTPTSSNIITGDETWVYGYDPDTEQQSSQWKSPNSPRSKKARQVRSNVKSMLIVFFDVKVIVH